jgi:hypothetical protein
VVTIFTVPKPFAGHAGMIQRNAIKSWARLDGVDVLLIGDDEGVAEAAHELGAQHIPDVERSAQGTPLVSAAFEAARSASAQPLLTFANADIILLPDFVESLGKVRFGDFLLVGQRWNADLCAPIQFDDPRWEQDLRATVAEAADLANYQWIDYFVFPRDSSLLPDFPPFVVGRSMWDNWLIRRARRLQVPVIDGTPSVTAVHQRHDYAHVPGGTGRHWEGPEAATNTELFGNGTIFGIWHATHVVKGRGVRPALASKYVRRRWETRNEVDGDIERLGRWIDPALTPARWLYRRANARAG